MRKEDKLKTSPRFCLALTIISGFLFSTSLLCQEPPVTPLDYSADCTTSGCHDEYLQRDSVHDLVSSGDCDSCHEAVESEEEEHRFTLIAEGAALCYECHDEYSDDLRYLHGPVAAGACLTCHDAHGSDHEMLLIDEIQVLCCDCHEDVDDRIKNMAFPHDPATEGCVDCHDSHGGDNQMNLIMSIPELCIDCHTEIEDVLAEATVKHDAMDMDNSCMSCHDPHGSDYEHIILKPSMDLCLSCHDEALESGETTIADIGLLLEEYPEHHGPIKEQDCSACHSEVHGGSHYRLLGGEYPPEFYAPYEEGRYAFCFECHEADLVKESETDRLTNFRNGQVNLHFLHVNRDKKGRTCRTCHETHASRMPFHIAESVPFGKRDWRIPINFEKTETGGSCLPGCHKQYGYDRVAPVVNLEPISKEE
jgi:predicted CXXCH cytochrome family protein